MAKAVIMPRQGQSVESCIITQWNVKEGDKVNSGDVLFTCETDKAAFDVESDFEGTILALLAEEGDDVPCLDNVCVIGQPGEDISEFIESSSDEAAEEAPEKAESSGAKEIVQETPAVSEGGDYKISPRAKNMAQRQNADLSKALASGPQGRIIERDVAKLVSEGHKVNTAAISGYSGYVEGTGLSGAVTTKDIAKAPAAQTQNIPTAGEFEEVKLSNVRKVIAKSMHASLADMAQLTLNSSFDATAIMEFRKSVKSNGQVIGLENITLNDMVVYATVKTLLNHGDCNAHFMGESIKYFRDVNMGIAVDTDRGLLVPTVYGANNMSLNELSAAAKDIIAKAQSGSISPDLLTGGTFTVTNLGSLGVESFTPVINPPQTCILGVCSIQDKVKMVNGEMKVYPSMTLSLTFDHRALDGAPAARFLNELCIALENFELLLGK